MNESCIKKEVTDDETIEECDDQHLLINKNNDDLQLSFSSIKNEFNEYPPVSCEIKEENSVLLEEFKAEEESLQDVNPEMDTINMKQKIAGNIQEHLVTNDKPQIQASFISERDDFELENQLKQEYNSKCENSYLPEAIFVSEGVLEEEDEPDQEELSREEREISEDGGRDPSEKFTCDQCSFETQGNPSLLDLHKKASHCFDLLSKKCPDCSYSSYSQLHLDIHIYNRHASLVANCKSCNAYSKPGARGKLKLHIETVHLKMKRFQCDHCDYRNNKKINLITHKRTKHDKPHKCGKCDFVTNYSYILKQHNHSDHLMSFEYSCSYCPYVAYKYVNLISHKRSKHSGKIVEDLKIKCENCEYSAYKETDLAAHIQDSHLNLKEFVCETCNYKTIHKTLLTQHKLDVHKPKNIDSTLMINAENFDFTSKRFLCVQCKYEAETKEDLEKHIISTHLKIKIERDEREKGS